jgi:predicted phage terminase large subunit-like protein
MIFMPPRHGKSEMVTIRYTAWRLLQNPKLNVILASYNQKLADKFSRRVKRIVRAFEANVGGAAYSLSSSAPATEKRSFSARRRGEPREGLLNSVSEWETRGGGVVRSVGVGAGIAGFGAGLIVIDDPVKNRAEAESETYRERVWEWFNDDIYTRMEPNAAIVLIQTRWHEDDLAGRLLREINEGGEKWDIVSLPALAEADAMQNAECKMQNGDPLGRSPGEALCPTRFPVKVLERYRRKLGSYSFASLYQQSPAPAEGGQFKRSWFAKVVDEAPAGLIWKRGYDLAVSTKTTADYTASFRCAYDKNGNLYIADGFRARIEYPEQRRYIAERMRRENGTEHGIESAMHGKAVVQELRRDVGLRRYPLREVRVAGDKLTRALTWLNLAEAGKVILVRGPWMDEFVDEIARFPTGKHDDQIDAVSIAVSMLTRRGGGLHFFSPPRQ